MGKLTGQKAWITGGGTGIGASAALALADAGAEVVLSGRRQAPLDAVAEQVRAAGGTASTYAVDIADAEAVAEAARAIGAVDILFANAGLNVPDRAITKLSIADWDKVVNVNLNGALYLAHAVLPGMRVKGGGLIIITSSWAGKYATSLTGAAYNATKRAVIALGESLNAEEGANGIRSTVLMPGEVATDILKSRPNPPSEKDQARMLQADDLGQTVLFLAELPPHACVTELVIAPTWNRFYLGFDEI